MLKLTRKLLLTFLNKRKIHLYSRALKHLVTFMVLVNLLMVKLVFIVLKISLFQVRVVLVTKILKVFHTLQKALETVLLQHLIVLLKTQNILLAKIMRIMIIAYSLMIYRIEMFVMNFRLLRLLVFSQEL